MFPKNLCSKPLKTSLETWVCNFKHTGETLTVEMDWHLKTANKHIPLKNSSQASNVQSEWKNKHAVPDSVWLSDFLFSPASSSFLSGVLCGYRGAAVHHLPQGSSVLQTLLLSGATCRYGEEKQTTWQRVYVCVGCGWGWGGDQKKKTHPDAEFCVFFFLCKVICMFSFSAQTVEITLKDRPGTQTLRGVRLNLHSGTNMAYNKFDMISVSQWICSGGNSALPEISLECCSISPIELDRISTDATSAP